MQYKVDYFGFVYIWRDKAGKRNYIGSHYGSLDDNYICSNKWMKAAYKKRPSDFRRKTLWILTEPDKAALQRMEQLWLNLIPDSQLSISVNVLAGTAVYYNMKKHASGGNGDANKGQKRGPGWSKGVTKEMIKLRRAGLFCLPCDRPKTKPDRGKGSYNKHPKAASVKSCKRKWPNTKIKRAECTSCSRPFWSTQYKFASTYKKVCSLSCRSRLNGAKTDSATNGKKGAQKNRENALGRFRVYREDGTWFWGKRNFSVSTQVASA